MSGKTVLIVDDEASIREMIAVALEMAGFNCIEASNAHDALIEIVDHKPDMILLDWMLPGTNGIELARRLRRNESTRDVPIIMLTAKADEDNKIHGLEVGVDDYIVKPFSPRELVARLKGVLRRTNPLGVDSKVEVEGLLLDPVSHRVTSNDASINLGPTEYKLLQFFMTHQNRVYTRPQLLDQVWGGNVYVEDRTVDVHILRLRKSLGEQHDYLVQTVRGTGYRFSTQKAS
ncbi:MAG: two-component system phosphate regulon response regulator PhoB [Oleiphilaceae bacterium]|jgi:two-component system phosphate regulon response regulator PhoB